MSLYWQTIETWCSLWCMPSNCFWTSQPLYKSFQRLYRLILQLLHFVGHHREILSSPFFAQGYLSKVIIWTSFNHLDLKWYRRCDIYSPHSPHLQLGNSNSAILRTMISLKLISTDNTIVPYKVYPIIC